MFLTFTTDLGQKTKGRTKWVECTHGTLGRESVGCERNTDHWPFCCVCNVLVWGVLWTQPGHWTLGEPATIATLSRPCLCC